MAPCLTSSFTNLLGKLPMAKVLLPLANLGVNMESEVVEDMRGVVGVFRELEHHNIYKPLSKLDSCLW